MTEGVVAPFDLRTARINAGLTQRELAETVGVQLPTIQRLEGGLGAYPSNAKKVADFFKVKVEQLMPITRSAA